MKSKGRHTFLQLVADATQSATFLILLWLLRYYCDKSLAGEIVVFVSSMNFVATFAGFSRDTPFLRFLSIGKKDLAKKLSIITGTLQLTLTVVIGCLFTLSFLPLWVFAGFIFGFYSVTVNELRYSMKPLEYLFIKLTYAIILILSSIYCIINSYDVRICFVLASCISIPLFLKHYGISQLSLKNFQFFIKYSSVIKLISYRSLSTGYIWAENIIIKQVSSLEVVGAIGIWRELLRIYSFLVQGINKANAVKLSREYVNYGNKIGYRKKSAIINIFLGGCLLLVFVITQVPAYLYIFIGISLFQNLQHTQSYYFFTNDKIWSLVIIVLGASICALLIQLFVTDIMQFYLLKLGMTIVIYVISQLYIHRFIDA